MKLLKRWIKEKTGIATLLECIQELERKVQSLETAETQTRKYAMEAVKIIKERTDINVDVHSRRGFPSQAIIVGKYKNQDYVRIFDIHAEHIQHLVEQLSDMEKYATVRRVDIARGHSGMFFEGLQQRRRYK